MGNSETLSQSVFWREPGPASTEFIRDETLKEDLSLRSVGMLSTAPLPLSPGTTCLPHHSSLILLFVQLQHR